MAEVAQVARPLKKGTEQDPSGAARSRGSRPNRSGYVSVGRDGLSMFTPAPALPKVRLVARLDVGRSVEASKRLGQRRPTDAAVGSPNAPSSTARGCKNWTFTGIHPNRWWGRRDSNPHWRRFKRPASADWATPPYWQPILR
jgi:hypothetical protein